MGKIFLLLFVFVSSCAPVISPELRGKVDSTLTFEQVLQSPDMYKGKFVLWGGEIQGATLGEQIKSVSEKDYRYPLLLSKQIHLWKEYFSPYSSLPPPRSPHDPYRYDPSDRPLRF